MHECAAALVQIALLVIGLKQAMSTTGYAYAPRIFIPSLHAIAQKAVRKSAIASQFSSALAYHLKKATLNEEGYHLGEDGDQAKAAN